MYEKEISVQGYPKCQITYHQTCNGCLTKRALSALFIAIATTP